MIVLQGLVLVATVPRILEKELGGLYPAVSDVKMLIKFV